MSQNTEPELRLLIQQVHDSPCQAVLAITGGGSRAIAELLEVPGGSRTLLEAIVPYSPAALSQFLRSEPEHYCSEHTARLMAMVAFQRAIELTRPTEGESRSHTLLSQPIGIGCTASLVSDRPKRGAHRIHVATQTIGATVTLSVTLAKGARDRTTEEALAARLILAALADVAGIDGSPELHLLQGENVELRRTPAPENRQQLILGERRQICIGRTPILVDGARRAVFPGAFNPIHTAHREMARIAAERLRLPVEYEISIQNVEKPPLDYREMELRAEQFTDEETLWLTQAPLFEDKTRLFPNTTFIVGGDTIARIADPRYVGDGVTGLQRSITRMTASGCRFLVFARRHDHQLYKLSELDLPPVLRELCDEVPREEFLHEISSTRLRAEEEGE
ncbi:MAG: hypothetical protein SGJ20_10420 [Planctomycetota bacterium]|nr:hypothetical protein [Planctomycetota bacterium]